MRKLIASVLISTLLVLPAPVLAAPSGRVNVEALAFEKIEQHMNTYNAQIYANNRKVADIEVPGSAAKASLEGMLAAVNAQIALYDGKIADLRGLAPDQNTVYLIDIYGALKTISDSNKRSLESQLSSFDENRNKASDAQTKAALQTEAGNKQIIWGAEQVYLAFNSLDYQIKQQRNQLYLLHKQYNIMKIRLQLGLVSKTIAQSLEKNIKDLEFAINAMTDQQKSLQEQLNITLNQNHGVDLQIHATPALDQNLLIGMNLEEDYEEADQLSYNVRVKDDDWEREAEERKFKLDFKRSYNNVFDKQESLGLEVYKLENQRELYEQAQLKNKLGLISKLALEEQRITFENQALKVQITQEDLFKAYRQYEWMKEGLSL